MITLISTPIKGEEGFYENVFPSKSPIEYKFNRKDAPITEVSSGTNNKVLIKSSSPFVDLEVGDFVTWETNAYELTSSRVIQVVSATSIEVDHPFSSANASNGWINFRKRWYLEARYVRGTTLTGNQLAIPVIDLISQISSAKSGDIILDASIVADNINPAIDYSDAEQESFSEFFKVQYRESYEGNRSGLWLSPDPDVPVLMVHGSKPITSDGFIDKGDYTRKFWRGYPVYVSYIHSDVNDNDTNKVVINANRWEINKTQIDSFELSSDFSVNGLLLSVIDPDQIPLDTTFIDFVAQVTTNKFQYDPEQYDPSQYA